MGIGRYINPGYAKKDNLKHVRWQVDAAISRIKNLTSRINFLQNLENKNKEFRDFKNKKQKMSKFSKFSVTKKFSNF